MHVCTLACESQKPTLGVIPQDSLLFFLNILEAESCISLELAGWVRLVVQGFLRDVPVSASQSLITSM